MSILVTGAAGSVGRELVPQLTGDVCATDVETMDVTDPEQVDNWFRRVSPAVVYHLAGAKHAPDGELDPSHVARVNIDGTLNVLRAAERESSRVILASTCKACDPETAYGASKLIAERATLNSGGVVVRFHNIPESDGNVFRLWESVSPHDPLPVTDCWRYFTALEDAVRLLVEAPGFPSGRYAVDPGQARWIPAVAADLYPDRGQVFVPRRRGDRIREPLHAECETIRAHGSYLRIVGAHDPVALPVAA